MALFKATFSFLVILHISESLRWRCPEPVGLFTHPTDCSKYINCYKSHATVQECPNCYVFNSSNGFCDFPENVDCSGKRIAEPVLKDECPGCFGLFQDASNCSVFYNCIGGIGIRQVCPDGLYFSEETQACDFDTAVGCPNSDQEGILIFEDNFDDDSLEDYDYDDDQEEDSQDTESNSSQKEDSQDTESNSSQEDSEDTESNSSQEN